MPPNAGNPHLLTNSIHLPSARKVETLVVLPDPTAGSFPIPSSNIGLHNSGTDVWGPHDPGS